MNHILGEGKKSAPKAVKAVPAPRMRDDEMRWKAQDALRTITQAEEFKRDKALMREVKNLATASMKVVCAPTRKK